MKKSKIRSFVFVLALAVFAGQSCYAQAVMYVDSMFDVTVSDTNLIYGTAVDYKGCTRDLKLDIYKPVGNAQLDRPLLVFVHGGSFIGGSKDHVKIVAAARQFAAKGYVVAAVDYRLGQHLKNYVPTPTVAPLFSDPTLVCHYFARNEVERAAFRGMQDVKDAIRFLKNRAQADSVSRDKFFVGGESAGGIISCMVGFLDDVSEKPDSCFAVSEALPPGNNLNCTLNLCATNSRLRPDLGDIDGNPSLFPNENANVAGVFSMGGGMFSNLFTVSNQSTKKLYVYHQTCDPVVASDSGRVYRWLDNCLYYCSAYTPYQLGIGPELKAATAIAGYENMATFGGTFQANIVQNGPPPNAYPNCNTCVIGAFTPQYSPCHDVLNPKAEWRAIAQLFLPCVTAVGIEEGLGKLAIEVYPNPTHDLVKVVLKQSIMDPKLQLFDQRGRAVNAQVVREVDGEITLDLSGLPKGIYFVRVQAENLNGHRIVVKD